MAKNKVPVISEEEFNRRYCHHRQVDSQYHAKSGGGDEVFHLFPKLPAELQLEVWKQAVKNLTAPELQEFDFDFAYDPDAAPQGRAGNGLVACFKPKRTQQLAGHLNLLMACVDSRKAFLDSSDYHMLPLTYLVGFEDKQTPKKIATYKIVDSDSQANKAFVRVLLPVSFEHTRFLIDTIPETFAYESVHPTPPRRLMAFGQAAGLEFVHSIKKLAFSQHKAYWYKAYLFCDWFANSADQCRYGNNTPSYTLGALEELSYVSAKAVERQCCIGADHIWSKVPSIAVQQFERRSSTSQEWEIQDLHRLDGALTRKWIRFHWDFNLRWGGSIRKKCTCRRSTDNGSEESQAWGYADMLGWK